VHDLLDRNVGGDARARCVLDDYKMHIRRTRQRLLQSQCILSLPRTCWTRLAVASGPALAFTSASAPASELAHAPGVSKPRRASASAHRVHFHSRQLQPHTAAHGRVSYVRRRMWARRWRAVFCRPQSRSVLRVVSGGEVREEVRGEGRARTRARRALVRLVTNYSRMKEGINGQNALSSASSSSKNREAAPSRRPNARQQYS
jgi:hypothetical protein